MVYMLLGTGFEEIEAVAPLDLLRRAGVQVSTVGINGKVIRGSHGIRIEADLALEEMDLSNLEMIILPGGLGGVASIRASKSALDAVRYAWENGKQIAAICAAPSILAEMGITDGKKATCYPSFQEKMGSALLLNHAAVTDGTLITGTSAGCAIPFGLKLVAALKGQEAADAVAAQIVIR